jgi:hypothetical protein
LADIGDALRLDAVEGLLDAVAVQVGQRRRDPRDTLLIGRERDLEDAVERQEGVADVVEAAALAHQAEREHRLLIGDLREIRQVELVADGEAAFLVAVHRPGKVAARQAAACHHKAALLDPRQGGL